MRQYLDIARKALNGTRKQNRTGVDTVGYIGDMCRYDLRDGFPIVTTKHLAFRSCIAEMLCFLRGEDNAAAFRKAGCNVWDANANENPAWLVNPYRRGPDDLGRIYGVQARHWRASSGPDVDQLQQVVDKLMAGVDDRRLIVSHWNPGELDQMALPPCHLMYQFGIEGNVLHLSMYQRSCDVPLGVPFNITGYAWLLSVIAHVTGYEAGVLTHFMHDIHVYENQIELLHEQLAREPRSLPKLVIDPEIETFQDLEDWADARAFVLEGYNPHGPIKYPFTV